MARYRILSLDGGGIKALFTATLLARAVDRYPRLLERVDLIAGTSSGGILALGLAAGRTPAALASLLRERAARIFDDSTWDDLVDLGRTVGADYEARALRRELRREFGELTLGDLERRVIVPAFDLDAPAARDRPRMWKPKLFHNFPGRDSDRGESVVDVALRTSAAPTYFPTYQGFIDGGLVANNPAMAALAQALDRRAAGRRLDELILLSIGAGTEPKFIRGKRLDWGWAQWGRVLVSLAISGVGGIADFQCRQLLDRRYFRLDRYFSRGVDLDDAAESTLEFLVAEAHDVHLDGLLTWLRDHRW